MFLRIDHVEIVAGDFERSLAFYQEVLGFRLTQRMEVDAGPLQEIAYLQLGDGMVELMRFADPAAAPAGPAIGCRALALEVDSMDAAVQRLQEKGVTVTWGPLDLGVRIRAEINDPDGTPIELTQWKNGKEQMSGRRRGGRRGGREERYCHA